MLNLKHTLDCGQAFRWKEREGVWSGIAEGRPLTVSQEEIDNGTSEVFSDPFWINYFDLESDYEQIGEELSALSPVMAEAVCAGQGLRILNQEPWEAFCSFVVSQNNNIKRIAGIIDRLCLRYGKKGSFPTPEALYEADIAELRALGLGFRDRYIHSAAEAVVSGKIDFNELRTMPVKSARKILVSVLGVGDKVADCTLLFGLHRLECFPKDVWIKRVMAECFPGKDETFFGPYAGIAQQYLFDWARRREW